MRLLLITPLFLLLATPLAADIGRIREKLIYDLSWTGIPVGTASHSIKADGDTLQGHTWGQA